MRTSRAYRHCDERQPSRPRAAMISRPRCLACAGAGEDDILGFGAMECAACDGTGYDPRMMTGSVYSQINEVYGDDYE